MDENIQATHFPTGGRELRHVLIIAAAAVLLTDFILYGGFNLGFAVMCVLLILASVLYLRERGRKMAGYPRALIILNLIIAASFVRSDDGFVKFIMVLFLLMSGNLSLALMTGQNRRSPNGITSLLDAPRALFSLGVGQLGNAFGGLNDARKNMGTVGKKNLAVLTGLAVAVPVLAILIPLLMRADAAFEGLIDLLPSVDFSEAIVSLLLGIPLACVLYTRNAALKLKPKEEPSGWTPKRFNALTVNTVLVAVCIVYLAYLVSQLAYFVGGFSGILPEGYTMAEYARRGFFEMTWLSALNLGLMTLAVGLTEPKDGRAPLATRILCLFIGIMTLFLAVAASAKMFLYIGSYGLTRLRVLTEVIMIFIALTVVFVTIWLFRPKFAYMKAVLLTALIIGACIAWADVDTVVAAYNVGAYRSGQLETVDMSHLCSLGSGAVPYIQKLTADSDPAISRTARNELYSRSGDSAGDIRSYTVAGHIADSIMEQYAQTVDTGELAEDSVPSPVDACNSLIDAAYRMTDYYNEVPHEEELVLLKVKDSQFFSEDNTLTDPYFDDNTMNAITELGIEAIWATDYFVVFWTDTMNYGLLWTAIPDATIECLLRYEGNLSFTAIDSSWYEVTS